MKSPYVKEIAANQLISTFFLVQNKEIRQKKSGEPYLSLSLGDRSGDLARVDLSQPPAIDDTQAPARRRP